MRTILFVIIIFIGGITPGCMRDNPGTVYLQDAGTPPPSGPALPPATPTRWLQCYSPRGILVWQGYTIATPVRGYTGTRWYHDILRPNNTFVRVYNAYSCVF